MSFPSRKSWGFELGNTSQVERNTVAVDACAAGKDNVIASNVQSSNGQGSNRQGTNGQGTSRNVSAPPINNDTHHEMDGELADSWSGKNFKSREPSRLWSSKSRPQGIEDAESTVSSEIALKHDTDHHTDHQGVISRCLGLKHLAIHYQDWLPLSIAVISAIFGASFLDPEQIDVLFSVTWGWFVGQEMGSLDDVVGAATSSFRSNGNSPFVDSAYVNSTYGNIAVLGLPALVALQLSMLLASLGWLQEFWSDIKARLVSRSALIAVALILSLFSSMTIKTNADEVLLVALTLGWLAVGVFQKIIGFIRALVGRSLLRLAPQSRNVRVVMPSSLVDGELEPPDTKQQSQRHYVDVNGVKVGDILRLDEGEQVPCDGIIMSGAAIVNEVRFSPLGRVVNRCKQDRLYAGSRILRGWVHLRVEEKFGDNDLAINLTNLDNSLNEPIEQDLQDYKQQRSMVGLGFIVSAGAASLHWGYFASLSASAAIAAAMLMGLVVVSVPTFFFPIRRLCLLRAFNKGSFISKASSLRAVSRVEHVVIDMPKGAEIVNCELRSFKILDDTLDVKATLDLILAILARVELKNSGHGESLWYSIHDAIAKDPKLRGIAGLGTPVNIEKFVVSNQGLHALVEGLPIYLGDVQFLLENNVVIDVGDVPYTAHPERLLILAMGREAIASLVIVPTSLPIEASDLKKLREWGYKVSLFSDADRKEVDLQGKVIGLDLGSIHGGVRCTELEDKLRSIPAAAIFSNRGIEKNIGLLVVPFDDLRREFEDGEITLFSRSLAPFVDLLVFVKHSEKFRQYLLWGGIIASLLSVAITLCLPQLIWVGLLIGGLTNLSAYISLKVLSPKL